MSRKVGVIGDKYSVMLFKLFDFQVHYAESSSQIRAAIRDMAEKDYGVIFITEEAAASVKETIESYKSRLTPAIILIPSQHGSQGIGMEEIRDNVERAIGQNIL
ncbi:V-type ATP synthase subunit F [Vagococcus elongatus]|uniref:V-type ATP synthase subunit F n=1 Tax=Vagococcus elongatus TaxID=180344 RepID=A0A430AQY9_9ENTE|nr:V-type ATP synthase subunit F [Vagococcus elongatus]RSU10542.1 V-type ATP synthase subunit F [Vagococcus elongatus]